MHLPYFEYKDFVDEWQEYIKAKIQAQKEREAERKKQESRQQSLMRRTQPSRPKKLK